MTRSRLPARCLAALLATAWLLAGAAPPPAASAGPTGAGHLAPQAVEGFSGGPLDPSRFAPGIERQIVERLDSRYEKILRGANEEDGRLREQMTLILDGTTFALTVILFILAVLAFAGIREFRQVIKTQRDAAARMVASSEQAAQETKKILDEAALETQKVRDLSAGLDQRILEHVKGSIEKTWSGLMLHFDQLPTIGDKQRLAGSAPDLVSPEARQAYEEADLLVVLGDKLGSLGGAEKATTYFNHLARFWWGVEDWARATARSRRAIELAPTCFDAYLTFAIGLMDRSDRPPAPDTATKLRLLAEAEWLLATARELKPEEAAQIVHRLGWIADEKGNFARAADLYANALTGQLTPELQGRIGYDLACAQCKLGQLQEAIDTLKPIIDLDDNRRLAATDPDFENLRQSSTLKVHFANLIAVP